MTTYLAHNLMSITRMLNPFKLENNMYKSTKTNFDFTSFRTDIVSNEKFITFKSKYGFKTRQELDLKLIELMRLDKTFYDYSADKTPRSADAYISTGKEKFLRVAPRVVKGYKSFLKKDQLEFDGYEYRADGLFLKLKPS
jgi:hypothetical protein